MDINTTAAWANIFAVPIAIIAILVSVALGLILYRRSKQKRELVCFFDAIEAPIEIRTGEALKGAINIFYEGQAIDNLFVVRANVVNRGNLSIRSNDILEPLTFVYGDNVELVRKPHIVKSVPDNLKVTCTTQSITRGSIPTAAIAEFELLNPSESFTVEMLCTGQSQHPSVSCRIDGLKYVQVMTEEQMKRRKARRFVNLMLLANAALFALFVVLLTVIRDKSVVTAGLELVSNLLALLTFVLLTFLILRERWYAR